jgi:hypothetical protein
VLWLRRCDIVGKTATPLGGRAAATVPVSSNYVEAQNRAIACDLVRSRPILLRLYAKTARFNPKKSRNHPIFIRFCAMRDVVGIPGNVVRFRKKIGRFRMVFGASQSKTVGNRIGIGCDRAKSDV